MDNLMFEKKLQLDENLNRPYQNTSGSFNGDEYEYEYEEDEMCEENLSEDDTLGFETDDNADAFVKIEEKLDRSKSYGLRKPIIKTMDQAIQNDILPLLPAKTLARFRSVSKEWDGWIKSPLFALRQGHSFRRLSGFFCQSVAGTDHTFLSLDHTSYGVCSPNLIMLPESVTIKSSSGGLLVCQGIGSTYYICNPATKVWKVLPKPVLDHGYDSAVVLAFDPSMSNIEGSYQVICAVRARDQSVVYFEVYSSITKSWRPSINALCVEVGRASFTGCGFYASGMAYWGTSARKVLAYSVENDMYQMMFLPPTSPKKGVFTLMQEKVYYIGMSRLSVNEYSIEIYSGTPLGLKHSVDVHLEVDLLEDYCVLSCSNEGEVLILVDTSIYSCRLSGGTVELISKVESGSRNRVDRVHYLPYVNNLVNVSG